MDNVYGKLQINIYLIWGIMVNINVIMEMTY